MSRIELALALGAPLLAAFAAGWLARWLWGRALAASSPRGDRADELAAELLLGEAERERMRAAHEAALSAAREAAETEAERLRQELRERGAEIEALDAGLRAAREEIAGLRAG